ncbi:hypothetical protein ALC62_01069 [Cyphomyrmex costatus]|uniref:Uncharacterized protein n=1 Tax=Cyphomyrmex costatus TaxID=456900 RepID=A0A151IPL3_9HYME|nr:hypothetical protein ALC62_01069 [Cyphomyrmex costatus]
MSGCKRRSWRAGELYELAEIRCKAKKKKEIIVFSINLPPLLPHYCHNMLCEVEYSHLYQFPSSAALNMAFASELLFELEAGMLVKILTFCITFCFHTIIVILPGAHLHTLAMWAAKNLVAYRL